MGILSVGIDLAKSVLAVHGVNEAGKPELVVVCVEPQATACRGLSARRG